MTQSRPAYLLPKAKAKRVIFLCMAGGPSHLETFDYKPKLDELNGKAMPESFTKGQPIAQLQGKELKVQGHLSNNTEVEPSSATTCIMADDIAIVRSMVTEQINHDPAHTFMNTGTAISGRPSMGSWVNYGLGSEAEDLPGFVVITSVGGRNPQPIASRQWARASCRAAFRSGIQCHRRSRALPAQPRGREPGRAKETGRRHHLPGPAPQPGDPGSRDRYPHRRLRNGFPDAGLGARTDGRLRGTPAYSRHVWRQTGGRFLRIELSACPQTGGKGVRFIHLYHRGWDHHGDLQKYMDTCCGLTDKPTWALIQDLKQRGMLEDTLVIWGGEFGRTPMFQGKRSGPGPSVR